MPCYLPVSIKIENCIKASDRWSANVKWHLHFQGTLAAQWRVRRHGMQCVICTLLGKYTFLHFKVTKLGRGKKNEKDAQMQNPPNDHGKCYLAKCFVFPKKRELKMVRSVKYKLGVTMSS